MVGESMRQGIGDWGTVGRVVGWIGGLEGRRKLDRWIVGQVAGKSLGLRTAG